MKTLGVVTGVGVCNSGVTVMARIMGNVGTPITQATLSGITYTVRDITAQTTVAQDVALTISQVVWDSLQQADPRWDLDDADNLGADGRYGYNFAATIPAAKFASYTVDSDTGNVTPHRYQIDIEFTPASGERFVQAFQFLGVPTYDA